MARARVLGFAIPVLPLLAGCEKREAAPPVHFEREEWNYHGAKGSKLTSEHYSLRTTCMSKGFVDALPGFMESCWTAYEKLVPGKGTGKPCESYLFGTRRQWERFTEEFAPDRAETYKKIRSGGYSERGLTVSHYDTQRSTLSVLAHEGLHQYLDVTHGKDIPAWLNEGLACYFESFDLDADNRPAFQPERNSLRSPGLREALQGKSLIPLKEILGTHAGIEVQKRAAHVRNYYAQEWSLVVFLMRDDKGNSYRSGFRQLLDELGTEAMTRKARALMAADTNGDMSSGEAVFRAYVSDDLDGFQTEYEAYLYQFLDMKS